MALSLFAAGDAYGASATQEDRAARMVVHFVPQHLSDTWVAAALEQTVFRDLSGLDRLVPIDKEGVDTKQCAAKARRCLLTAYADAGVDVVMLGTLDQRELEFAVYAGWTRALESTGSVRLGRGSGLVRLRQQAMTAVKPFVQSDGLLDQRPAPAEPTTASADSEPAPPAPSSRWDVKLALLLGVLFFLFPRLLAWWLARRDAGGPLPKSQSGRWSSLIILMLLGILATYAIPQLNALARSVPLQHLPLGDLRWLGPILGGVAWGWFALTQVRLIVPSLFGVERIRHRNVWPLLEAWAFVSVQRALLVGLLYLPFGLGAWHGLRFLGVAQRDMILMVMPLVGLMTYFWALALIDNLALVLDRHLVDRQADLHNPWHSAIKKYFMGYVRRSGLALDEDLLQRILLLPGKREGVYCYGGGLARPRIVIGPTLLDAALGALDESVARVERSVELAAWDRGLLPPWPPELASGWRRRARKRRRLLKRLAKELKRGHTRAAERRRAATPKLIGQNATLLGYVTPLARGETVPLISNDQEDFGVVRELLTEHYAAFEKDSLDEEYDDTDPTQKDFLFGAILREFGRAQRRESLWATLLLTFVEELERTTSLTRTITGWVSELYQRIASRYPTFLADSYVVLNHGRDHLFQYLFMERSDRLTHLTARADAPHLLRLSHEILRSITAEETTAEDQQIFRATPRNRLVWLSRYLEVSLPEPHVRRFRIAVAALVVVTLGATLAFAVQGSVIYSGVYAERMQALRAELAERQQEGMPEHGGSH